MASFQDLEGVATDMAQLDREAHQIDEELRDIQEQKRKVGRKSDVEVKFAKLIGLEPRDVFHELEKTEKELLRNREVILDMIRRNKDTFVKNLLSDIVVPLEQTAKVEGNSIFFPYRKGATFPKTIEFIGRMLQEKSPIWLEDVALTESGVRVKAATELEGKAKIVDAFTILLRAKMSSLLVSEPTPSLSQR